MAFNKDHSIMTTVIYLLSVERFVFTTSQLNCVNTHCTHDVNNPFTESLTVMNCDDTTQPTSGDPTEYCIRQVVKDNNPDTEGVVEINCGRGQCFGFEYLPTVTHVYQTRGGHYDRVVGPRNYIGPNYWVDSYLHVWVSPYQYNSVGGVAGSWTDVPGKGTLKIEAKQGSLVFSEIDARGFQRLELDVYGANTLAQSDIRAPLFYDGSTPNVVITIHDDGVDMKGPWRCWEGSYYGLDSSSCTGSAAAENEELQALFYVTHADQIQFQCAPGTTREFTYLQFIRHPEVWCTSLFSFGNSFIITTFKHMQQGTYYQHHFPWRNLHEARLDAQRQTEYVSTDYWNDRKTLGRPQTFDPAVVCPTSSPTTSSPTTSSPTTSSPTTSSPSTSSPTTSSPSTSSPTTSSPTTSSPSTSSPTTSSPTSSTANTPATREYSLTVQVTDCSVISGGSGDPKDKARSILTAVILSSNMQDMTLTVKEVRCGGITYSRRRLPMDKKPVARPLGSLSTTKPITTWQADLQQRLSMNFKPESRPLRTRLADTGSSPLDIDYSVIADESKLISIETQVRSMEGQDLHVEGVGDLNVGTLTTTSPTDTPVKEADTTSTEDGDGKQWPFKWTRFEITIFGALGACSCLLLIVLVLVGWCLSKKRRTIEDLDRRIGANHQKLAREIEAAKKAKENQIKQFIQKMEADQMAKEDVFEKVTQKVEAEKNAALEALDQKAVDELIKKDIDSYRKVFTQQIGQLEYDTALRHFEEKRNQFMRWDELQDRLKDDYEKETHILQFHVDTQSGGRSSRHRRSRRKREQNRERGVDHSRILYQDTALPPLDMK